MKNVSEGVLLDVKDIILDYLDEANDILRRAYGEDNVSIADTEDWEAIIKVAKLEIEVAKMLQKEVEGKLNEKAKD